MRTITIIFLFLLFGSTSGQNKIDSTLLLNTDWVQIDDSPNGLDNCLDCKSTKLSLFKDKTWGTNEIIVDAWKIKSNGIVLINTMRHGTGINCKIVKLTDKLLVLKYSDTKQIPRQITLKPISK